MSLPENIQRSARALDRDDLPREIAFAKAALNEDDPATVYWLAALFARFDAEYLRFTIGGSDEAGWDVIDRTTGRAVPGCDDCDYAEDAQAMADRLNNAENTDEALAEAVALDER